MLRTAFIATKEESIKRTASILIAQGYSENNDVKKQFVDRLRGLLGAMTTWNPDIFLVHRNGTILVADVQLLEEIAQYIPVAMEQAVPKIGPDFGSVKVVLYIPMGGVLEPYTIQKAAKLNIAVEAIDQAGVIHRILEPSTVCQACSPNTEETQTIKIQRDSGWIIPRVLVQKLSNIENLEYSNHLQQFADIYFHTSTPIRLSVQYKLASECIENTIKYHNFDLCCESLRLSKELQKMARMKGESRDHFLHEFQTFLMGAIILDSFESSSSSPFVLCNRYKKMGLPWLIASIFHDFGFDLANLESCINTAIGQWRYESRVNLSYSALLNSLYDFQKNNGDLDDWNPNSYVVRSSDLERITFSAAIEKSARATRERLRANHGVLSAHEIINLEERLSKQISGLRPIFMSSALSVSLHDKALWAELFANSIFPAETSRFPLLYLLILCDTLAEAGRPKKTKVGQQDTVLASFNIEGNVLKSAVWFSELERACTMNFWLRFVQESCFINPFLKVECKSLM